MIIFPPHHVTQLTPMQLHFNSIAFAVNSINGNGNETWLFNIVFRCTELISPKKSETEMVSFLRDNMRSHFELLFHANYLRDEFMHFFWRSERSREWDFAERLEGIIRIWIKCYRLIEICATAAFLIHSHSYALRTRLPEVELICEEGWLPAGRTITLNHYPFP